MNLVNLEIIGVVAASLTTISFLPQAIVTLRTRNTKSLSLSMYSLQTVGISFWLAYGVLLDNIIMIVANVISLCFATLILSIKIRNVLASKDG